MNQPSEHSLRFAVLGPVRAWRGDEQLDLGSPQQRLVLTALLLRRGNLVTIRDLVHAVWGDEPPAAAVSVLRTYVSRLRKVLEPGRDAGQAASVLISAADGYVAQVPDDALDLGAFERRVAQARARHAAGETHTAADLLHAALDDWNGTPLAGLNGVLVDSERSRLDEERLRALELRFDIDVQLGRHSEVMGELRALTDEHPLRERLCHLLMLALYRSGQRAEALACYRRTRRVLAGELGVEPGPALRDLHDRILVADASLDLALDAPRTGPQTNPQTDPPTESEPPYPAHAVRPAQLPADLPTFIGRKSELDQVRALLPSGEGRPTTVLICAIAGMAGIGKTTLAVRLAHEIADRFPDGQLFINLRGYDPADRAMPPGEAIRFFLDSLGVPTQRIPAGLDAQVSLYRSLLARRRVLIVLDNAHDTDQVRPLLPGFPGCLVVVTSRNRLTGLIAGDGAQPLVLDQLTPAEAHTFLTHRLGAHRLAAEPTAADEIITRCGRLPLALAIVAARAATRPGLPLSATADELRDSLDAFSSGDLSTDVRAVFSWSYKSLSPPAARFFRLLGMHPGSDDFSAPAAAALAGLPPRDARLLIAELSEVHLLIEPRPGRYRLHDLLRVYATERAHAEEDPVRRDQALERLLSWYLHTAKAASTFLTPGRKKVPLEPLPPDCEPLEFGVYQEALEWCDTERSNLVAAVHAAAASGFPGIAWRLPAVMWGFFYLRMHVHDWLDTSQKGLAAAHDAHDRHGEAWSLGGVACALPQMRRFDEAITHRRREMALWRDLGDVDGMSSTVNNLGNLYLQAGQLDKAVEYIRRGLALKIGLGDSWGEGIALSNLGDVYQRLGRFDEAVECLEKALTVLRAHDNRWAEGVTLDTLGTVAHRLHRHRCAIERYHQALAAYRDTGNRWREGHTLDHLGDVHLAIGELEDARSSWLEALAIFEEFDHPDAKAIWDKLHRLTPRRAAGGNAPSEAVTR